MTVHPLVLLYELPDLILSTAGSIPNPSGQMFILSSLKLSHHSFRGSVAGLEVNTMRSKGTSVIVHSDRIGREKHKHTLTRGCECMFAAVAWLRCSGANVPLSY